jgi:glutamyl-tRNA synthetase
MKICRFSPSSTGRIHLGSLRTALTSYILAKQAGGKYILRIEDTDVVRSSDEWTTNILDTFKWLGIQHDGDVWKQMERHAQGHYTKVAEKLISKGFAYYCNCSVTELKNMKANQIMTKARLGYNGTCKDAKHAHGVLRLNIKAIVERFGMPRIPINDSILGSRTEDYRNLPDPVLLRADGTPTYLLANTADDAISGVSHVVRGFDLFPQTPTQVLLYHAIVGWAPTYCHLPLITDESGAKLSKRNPEVMSILEYKEQGYLQDAVMQFAMSLGNKSIPTDRAIGFDELVKTFDISKSRSSNTGFATHQLMHINRLHLRVIPDEKLSAILKDNYGIVVTPELAGLFKHRAGTLNELASNITFTIDLLKNHMDELRVLASENFGKTECKLFRSVVLQGRDTPPLEQLIKLVA